MIAAGEKVIDVKVAKPRRKKKMVLYLALLAFLLWIGLALAVADKYHYHRYFKKPVVPVVAASPHVFEITPQIVEEASPNVKIETPLAPMPQEDMKPAVNALEKRVQVLEASRNNLVVYFAARDLKDSLDDPDNFKEQLAFLKDDLAEDLNVSGKIDILEQATSDGLVTRADLVAELGLLKKNLNKNEAKGFTGSVKSALGNLVKVTKTEGNIDPADYESAIKRAQIALTAPKIPVAALEVIIMDIKKLGKESEAFVRKANNFQRVLEVTDYLVIYTKSKTLANNG